MDPSKFDELTKTLASPNSRRQALRRIGGILGGTTLAGLFPGLALANNSACAHFCASVFGADTPAADQCTSEAAHGTGLCHQCGSATPPTSICCVRNSSGYCSSYSGAKCPCDNSQCLSCHHGTCVFGCASGQACQNGTCVLVPVCLGQTCMSDIDCCPDTFCTATFCGTGGEGVCCGSAGVFCTSDSDCCCGASCDLTTNTCGCFTAGTLIAMADGTSRPIEHILVGDLVLGNAGRVNRVNEVLLPKLWDRPLYSLNGSNFFVTSGHPFMTVEGWKSIDPAATPAQLSELHVDRLTVGDRLLTLKAAAVPVGAGRASSAEAVDVRIEAVALHSLVGQPADPTTQLYNLRLDGDHTYFANDLLVHNK